VSLSEQYPLALWSSTVMTRDVLPEHPAYAKQIGYTSATASMHASHLVFVSDLDGHTGHTIQVEGIRLKWSAVS
jgi:hypothetical protein